MKYALVTGASRGIGRAVAERLAKDGLPVIINYRSNNAAAEETKKAIEAAGGQAELLPFDVSRKEQVEEALAQWESQHPEDYIGVLVNNAGIRHDNLLALMSDDDWHSVLDTTLNGFFYLTRRVLPHMVPRRRTGRIINIASLSGLKGLPGQANYSAAKAGIIGATKAVAQEVAARDVTVNAVAPGFIDTDMTRDLDQETLRRQIPMQRFGRPEEVAGVVSFLASDDASYVTGNVININGGLYT